MIITEGVKGMLRLKGINEPPQEEDGFRILIDEYWPKGLSKEVAKVDLWIKETKDLEKWPENDSKYHKKTLTKFIRDAEKEKGTVTFLYSTIQSILQLQL